jgi:hypothetical protein
VLLREGDALIADIERRITVVRSELIAGGRHRCGYASSREQSSSGRLGAGHRGNQARRG